MVFKSILCLFVNSMCTMCTTCVCNLFRFFSVNINVQQMLLFYFKRKKSKPNKTRNELPAKCFYAAVAQFVYVFPNFHFVFHFNFRSRLFQCCKIWIYLSVVIVFLFVFFRLFYVCISCGETIGLSALMELGFFFSSFQTIQNQFLLCWRIRSVFCVFYFFSFKNFKCCYI